MAATFNFNYLPIHLSIRRPPSMSIFTCSSATRLLLESPATSLPLIHTSNLNTENPPSLACALQCLHFQSCSGCTHEHNLHRPAIVDEAADFFQTFGVSGFTFDSCRLWGWRCRAKLAVRGSFADPRIGLYEEGTHTVVDIPDCKAHHPRINAAVDLLKKGITELKIEPFDEDQGTGDLRYVQMAVTTYDTSLPASQRYNNGKVQISLVWNSRSENSSSSEKLNALANFLWRNGGPKRKIHMIHSVWANFQTSDSNIIFGNRWRHLLGEEDLWEHVGGVDVALAPSSFGQANSRAFDCLLRKLQKYVPYGASVVDLYAGAGVIGISLAAMRKCRSVKCVEINKESKRSFEKTVERLPSTLNCSISWHHANTSADPHSWLVGSDVIVVDPPRKGLEPSLLKVLQTISAKELKSKMDKRSITKDEKRPWILRAQEASVHCGVPLEEEQRVVLPQTLIYVSCGWQSFKEDCRSLLSSKTWHLEKAHGFNFLPGTQSIEILAVFKKGGGGAVARKQREKKKKRRHS